MTDDEKRALKGQVLLEATKTEQHLAALRVKAARHGQVLEHLGKALLGNPSNALKPADWQRGTTSAQESLLSLARESLAHDDLLALVNEYEATVARLNELNAQKRSLGIAESPRTA